MQRKSPRQRLRQRRTPGQRRHGGTRLSTRRARWTSTSPESDRRRAGAVCGRPRDEPGALARRVVTRRRRRPRTGACRPLATQAGSRRTSSTTTTAARPHPRARGTPLAATRPLLRLALLRLRPCPPPCPRGTCRRTSTSVEPPRCARQDGPRRRRRRSRRARSAGWRRAGAGGTEGARAATRARRRRKGPSGRAVGDAAKGRGTNERVGELA